MHTSLSRLLADWGFGELAPWLTLGLLLLVTLIVAMLAHQIVRRLLLRGLHSLVGKTRTKWDDLLVEHHVFQRLTHLVPAMVFYLATPLIFIEMRERNLVQSILLAYMMVAGMLAISAFLSALNRIYETSFAGAGERPIRSYLQVVSLFFWALAAILIVGTLTGRSPWALLGGLGAMTAVLMLVFKDSILGLVSSIQLTANDMVRIGDWIEMPQFGADGNVSEILLTTVKVRNWDMTITTIPSYRLTSDAFKNWRGMTESGVRRVRRSFLIDQHSVRFVDDELMARFRKIQSLQEYLDAKLEEVRRWNEDQGIDATSPVNGRRLTNVGTFRAYLEGYIRSLPNVDHGKTLMVHQQPPTEKGLPLQIYFFSYEQRWAHWEAIQADIFDHVLSVAPEFDLRVVQAPTGADLRELVSGLAQRG